MPHSRNSHCSRHSHNKHRHPCKRSNFEKGRRGESQVHHRKRRSDRPSSREMCRRTSCGEATLDFCAVELGAQDCAKTYLFIDSNAAPFTPGGIDPTVNPSYTGGKSIVPIDAKSMVVTWDFAVTSPAGVPEDLTRYIIFVERFNESCVTPVVRFQVPISHAPLNDCVRSQASQLKGTSQPFRVKLCAGDQLIAAVVKRVGENCVAGLCGAGPTPGNQTQTAHIDLAIVKLFIF